MDQVQRGALSRRRFVWLSGVAAAGVGLGGLAGCGSAPVGDPVEDDLAVSDESLASSGQAAPQLTPEQQRAQAADAILANMTLEQKILQLFFVTPESLTGVGVVTAAGDATRTAFEQRPVGGLIYFTQNLVDELQTTQMLQNTLQFAKDAGLVPPFLCVDEEGGLVSRVGGNPGFNVQNQGDMVDVGATDDVEVARGVAETIGGYLKPLGFSVDFAPVCDIAPGPESEMYQRSFGSDPALVASMVQAQVQGFESAGVACCAKHFPGIGQSSADSHQESIYSERTREDIESSELVPFKAAMDAGVPFVMVGHLSMPAMLGHDVPASLSADVVQAILRDQMGYQGVVCTDSLSMGAITNAYGVAESAVMALEAGCDVPLMPLDLDEAVDGVYQAVKTGRLTEDRIGESVRRILLAKLEYIPDAFPEDMQG